MGFGIRAYLVTDADKIQRVPYSRITKVLDSKERMPEFASRRLRYAIVYLQTVDRRPVGIRHMDRGWLTLNSHGRRNPKDALTEMRDAADAMSSLGGYTPQHTGPTVLNAADRFAAKRYQNKNSWKASEAILSAIGQDLFSR
jgi:hypothetical protein